MVTGPFCPLIVVPSAAVRVIWPGLDWLIVKLTEPSSERLRLPPTRLAVTFDGTSRSSSDSRTGRNRCGFLAGAPWRRPRLRNNFGKTLETNIATSGERNKLVEPGKTTPEGSRLWRPLRVDLGTHRLRARRFAARRASRLGRVS